VVLVNITETETKTKQNAYIATLKGIQKDIGSMYGYYF
jgi:glycine cleavage system protein P-like pyridoxal-binding family